jgi:hypothetical protein
MEQEVIINIGDFDHSAINLEKPADTSEEFIKQVIVERERCADIAVAKNIDRSKFKKPTSVVPEDLAAMASCSFAPPLQWSQTKVVFTRKFIISFRFRLTIFRICMSCSMKSETRKST